MGELLDIYDENLTHIGTKDRAEVHRDGDWHRVFHCWIIYRDDVGTDYIIVQRRASEKQFFPNLLDVTAAGHYEAGETIKDGVREIREELGLEIQYEDLVSLGIRVDAARFGNLLDYEFSDVFFLINNQPLHEYMLQADEVAAIVRFKVDDGIDLVTGDRTQILAQSYPPTDADIKLSLKDFVPRVDAYLYKILVLAKRRLAGEIHLVI